MPEETTTSLPPLSRASLDIALANMFSHPTHQQSYVFYAHLIGQCQIVLERMEAPAAVSFHLDHYRLHINPELFDNFTLEEQLFILQHEMHHILNKHVGRLEDRNPRAFNYATDCAINQLGNPSHMPQGLIIPATFPSKQRVPDKLSAEQYYEYLNEDDFPPEDPQFGHDKWGESKGDPELQDDITKNMIDKAVNETQKSRCNLPSEISRYLDLFSRKRELDWKKVLRGITGNKKVHSRKTILRKDRRNPNYDHLKGKVKDRMFDLAVVSDVSGSVSDAELYSLWGEIRHICDVTKTPVSVCQVDTHAYKPTQLKKTTKVMPRKAAGGTYLSPAIQMLKDTNTRFNALVVTTDGELCDSDVAQFEALHIPVIWLISPHGTVMSSMSNGRMKAFKLKE